MILRSEKRDIFYSWQSRSSGFARTLLFPQRVEEISDSVETGRGTAVQDHLEGIRFSPGEAENSLGKRCLNSIRQMVKAGSRG